MTAQAIDVGPGSGFWFDIVGESNYQGTLRKLSSGRLEREEEVVLNFVIVPEPNNQFDRNALAVFAEGAGKVGYFDRDSASHTFAGLRELLVARGVVGSCEGQLVGGWDYDKHIGVRLSLRPPNSFSAAGIMDVPADSGRARGIDVPPGWEALERVALPAGRGKGASLIEEYLCQDELQRICGDRDPSQETVVFEAAIVPADGGATVCAVGGAPVGRFSKTDRERYADALRALTEVGAVGTADAWIIPERGGLGVRLSIATPAALAKLGGA